MTHGQYTEEVQNSLPRYYSVEDHAAIIGRNEGTGVTPGECADEILRWERPDFDPMEEERTLGCLRERLERTVAV